MASYRDAQQALRNLQQGIRMFGAAVKRASKEVGTFTTNVTRAHYHVLGQYTFPLEQEVCEDEGSQVRPVTSYNILGQILIFPAPLLAWFSALTWLPLLGNTVQSIPKGFVSAINLSLKDCFGVSLPYRTVLGINMGRDTRNVVRRVLYGGLGYLAGAIPGLALSIFFMGIKHTFVTFGRIFTECIDYALPNGWGILQKCIFGEGGDADDDRPGWKKYGIGLIGLVIGIVSGLAAMLVIGFSRAVLKFVWIAGGLMADGLSYLGRRIKENAFTTARTFAWFANITLRAGGKIEADNVFSAGWGIPGLIMGSISGLVGMLVIGAARIIFWALKKMLNAVVAGFRYAWDASVAIAKFCWTASGYGYDVLKDNALTFGRTFAWFFNKTSPWEIQVLNIFDDASDQRLRLKKYGIGLPGLVVGGVSGILAMLVMGACRIVKRVLEGGWYVLEKNVLAFCRIFACLVNKALPWAMPELHVFEENEPGLSWVKNTVWLPGGILGAVSGLLAMLVVGAVRIVFWALEKMLNAVVAGFRYAWDASVAIARICWTALGYGVDALKDNALTLGRTFAWFFNKTSPLKIQMLNIFDDASDQRSYSKKYGIGIFGLIVGSVSGLSVMPLIGAARIIFWVLKQIVNAGIAGLGYVCRVAVAIADFCGTVLGYGLDGIKHNVLTLGRVFSGCVDYALPEGRKGLQKYIFGEGDENTDNRPVWKKYGVGFLGLVIGSVSGAIAILAIYIARGIWKMGGIIWQGLNILCQCISHIIISVANFVIEKGTAFLRCAGGVFKNSAWTLIRTFAWFFNKTSPWKVPAVNIFDNAGDQRSGLEKYGAGVIGLIVGGVSGLVAMLAMGILRIVFFGLRNIFKSWCVLSGSFINMGMERFWFKGSTGDIRSEGEKAIGFLGYVVACLTTLPFASLVFVIRKTPSFCGTLLGIIAMVAASIVILPCKLLSKIFKYWRGIHRFNDPNDFDDPIIQRFKNLYSSLSMAGEFTVYANVVEDGSGEKSYFSFIRKCFTLNMNTRTEEILDQLLETYRTYKNKSVKEERFEQKDEIFTESAAFKEVIETIKADYIQGCTFNTKEIEEIHNEIDELGKFIKEYLQLAEEPGAGIAVRQRIVIPHIYSKLSRPSWAAFFRGIDEVSFPSHSEEESFAPEGTPYEFF
jgi:hypothetical protein